MTLGIKQKRQIVELYLDPSHPGSFGSVDQFRKHLISDVGIEVDLKDLKQLLREFIPSLTVDKPQQERFPRRVHLATSIDQSWSGDLFFLSEDLLRANRCKAFLILVDVLSHYCFVKPIKSKKGEVVGAALQAIIEETGRKPHILVTDQGREFLADQFQQVLRQNSIHHQLAYQKPNKAHTAELHIRLLKDYIKRYLRQNKTKQFLAELPDFVNSLNNRSLEHLGGLSPIELTGKNQFVAIEYLEKKSGRQPKGLGKFEVGDFVRIQLPKSAIAATRQPRYSEELFIVDEILANQNPVLYKLKDLASQPLGRLWYGAQLVLVSPAK